MHTEFLKIQNLPVFRLTASQLTSDPPAVGEMAPEISHNKSNPV